MPPPSVECLKKLRKVLKLHLHIGYGCSSKETEKTIMLLARGAMAYLTEEEKLQIGAGELPLGFDFGALEFFAKKVELPPGRALRDVVGALPAPVAAAPARVEEGARRPNRAAMGV